ncbi:FGGY-family carbohydrate kinase [Chitinophaga pinensis]|uniref:Carbohydrate kinase FGGY n=1 Tax=Chitinophaga pinensis (strain ATCC 43595 / DSM 2588 / LMG 13176 / NBRC 15968 / NCIMB 11800 / UQM 2034) TaxID=485918 RepID=A0A979G7W7_CHIPD|nr:FGGY family carbohydrate kinase [Chitinophaga pinensis]ACU62356.1 carbohydrate kinase FGGY [Chitinophaga pinensis DSM 2588]
MRCIAILDIGKTNKKAFLIDEHYRIVRESGTCFPEIKDEDGDLCEDITLLTNWVRDSLRELVSLPEYTVTAINFSTYGASMVYLDEEGHILAPLYNYLKPFPQGMQEALCAGSGGLDKVCSDTASPALGSLNAGLQLYRIKQTKPALFDKIRYALHLPQYISFLVTGQPLSDITSVGCHTMLWDFSQQRYHEWVLKEGLTEKLAPIFPGNRVLPATIEGSNYMAGVGLHDSSAALIPYLSSFSEPFALISTGTWCITLNPFNNNPLTPAELAADCLCYLTYENRPVKAARLFAGNEHEQEVKRLAEYYQTPVNYYQQVVFDPAIFAQLLAVAPQHQTPVHGTGLLQSSRFAERPLTDFISYEIAYHRLLMDIMEQQQFSSSLVLADTPVKRIFVDGGFSRNTVYMHLLAAAFPHMEVYAASVAQATAVGAALAIHRHWNTQQLPADLVEMRHYSHGSIYI